MTAVLDDLLSPLTSAEFWTDYYERRPVLLRGMPGRFAQLYGVDEFTRAVNRERDVDVTKNGGRKTVESREQLVTSCEEGTTVVVTAVDKQDETVGRFAAALEEETGSKIGVNAYYSQEDAKGLNLHYDFHDVFILQLEGKKHWRVLAEPVAYPTAGYPMKKISKSPEGEAAIDAVLEPGDFLYVPRGWWHIALAVDGPSLHLTTGIYPITGHDFLRWWTDQLREDARFRTAIPPGPVGDDDVARMLTAFVTEITQLAAARLTDPQAIAAAFRRDLARVIRRPAKFKFASRKPPQLTMETRFTRRIRQSALIERENGHIHVTVGPHALELQAALEDPMRFIFSRAEFTLGDVLTTVPDEQAESVSTLIETLLKEKVVEIS